MTITLQFTYKDKPVKRNLEVSIHWQGYDSIMSNVGHTKLQTDESGCVYVDEKFLNGKASRKTERIYIENPNGGYALRFPKVELERDKTYILPIEGAEKQ